MVDGSSFGIRMFFWHLYFVSIPPAWSSGLEWGEGSDSHTMGQDLLPDQQEDVKEEAF